MSLIIMFSSCSKINYESEIFEKNFENFLDT